MAGDRNARSRVHAPLLGRTLGVQLVQLLLEATPLRRALGVHARSLLGQLLASALGHHTQRNLRRGLLLGGGAGVLGGGQRAADALQATEGEGESEACAENGLATAATGQDRVASCCDAPA